MKSNQKITRVQLKIEHEEEFILLGLVSAEPDYKLSQSINKRLAISLRNSIPVKTGDDKTSAITFSRFTSVKNSPEIIFNLISNRSGKNFLLKKLNNIDYLFQVHDPENLYSAQSLTALMREIESVSAVFYIDLLTFRDKNLHYITQ
jgi:hypothetical protein